MTLRNRLLPLLVVVAVVTTTLTLVAASQAKPRECSQPPGEAIVEAGLGRIKVSGRLSKGDIRVVKKFRTVTLVSQCTTRRQEGNTQNLEQVLDAAVSMGPYMYFAALWGGGGLTVRGFVTEPTAQKLTSLGGGPFQMDTRNLNVFETPS
jgi:hypothetical protein